MGIGDVVFIHCLYNVCQVRRCSYAFIALEILESKFMYSSHILGCFHTCASGKWRFIGVSTKYVTTFGMSSIFILILNAGVDIISCHTYYITLHFVSSAGNIIFLADWKDNLSLFYLFPQVLWWVSLVILCCVRRLGSVHMLCMAPAGLDSNDLWFFTLEANLAMYIWRVWGVVWPFVCTLQLRCASSSTLHTP